MAAVLFLLFWGVGGRRNEHVSVGGRHVSEKGGHVSDKVMEELERTAEYYTSYFRARGPLTRENLSDDVNACHIVIDHDKIYYSTIFPRTNGFYNYVSMLERMLADWNIRGLQPIRCSFSTNDWDLDVDEREFAFIVKTASSRYKYTQSILWPNFWDALEFSSGDCGQSVDLAREPYHLLPWNKRDSTPIFRGTLTNYPQNPKARKHTSPDRLFRDLDFAPRPYLIRYSQLHPDQVNASWTAFRLKGYTSNEFETKYLHSHYGHPNRIPRKEYYAYKFPIVIHGYGTAYRLREHFAAGACVLLHDSFLEEWYYYMMRPYVHYVPISDHMADLQSQLEWVRKHPSETEKIGKNARKFYESFLTFRGSSDYVHSLLTRIGELQRNINLSIFASEKGLSLTHPKPCNSVTPQSPAKIPEISTEFSRNSTEIQEDSRISRISMLELASTSSPDITQKFMQEDASYSYGRSYSASYRSNHVGVQFLDQVWEATD
ncbi:hypothetical protein AAMO2058_001515100 [Amorphochlora amoebiformis]